MTRRPRKRHRCATSTTGADGIVGVRLDIEFKEFGSDGGSFIAIGTAVHPLRPDHQIAVRQPMLSLTD